MECDISFLFDFKSIRSLLVTVMGSNFVSFCRKNSSTNLSKKKVYELILSNGSALYDKIAFETSILRILNEENFCVPIDVTNNHHDSGLLLILFCYIYVRQTLSSYIYCWRICAAVIAHHQHMQDTNKSQGITIYPIAVKNPSEERYRSLKRTKPKVLEILVSYNVGALKDLKTLRLKPESDIDNNCLISKLFALWLEHPEATAPR